MITQEIENEIIKIEKEISELKQMIATQPATITRVFEERLSEAFKSMILKQ